MAEEGDDNEAGGVTTAPQEETVEPAADGPVNNPPVQYQAGDDQVANPPVQYQAGDDQVANEDEDGERVPCTEAAAENFGARFDDRIEGKWNPETKHFEFLNWLNFSKLKVECFDTNGYPCIKIGGEGIRPHDYQNWQALVLQKFCGRLGIKKMGNATKSTCIAQLVLHHQTLRAYQKANVEPPAASSGTVRTPVPSQQPGCSFRIMNLIFSSDLMERFILDQGASTRQQLDDGDVNGRGDNSFWKEVSELNKDADNEIAKKLVYQHDLFEGIDLTVAIPHSSTKCFEIFKESKNAYSIALARFRQSGKHESEFPNYCNGSATALYMRYYQQAFPNITNAVNRKNAAGSSTIGGNDIDLTSAVTPTNESTSNSAKRRSEKVKYAEKQTESLDRLATGLERIADSEQLGSLNNQLSEVQSRIRENRKRKRELMKEEVVSDDDEILEVLESIEYDTKQMKRLREEFDRVQQEFQRMREAEKN